MTAQDVANAYDVALSTVHYWVKTKRLTPADKPRRALKRQHKYRFAPEHVVAVLGEPPEQQA